jgi:hypothetical protein
VLLSLPLDQHASLPASVPVTAITDLLFGYHHFLDAADARVLIHARATPVSLGTLLAIAVFFFWRRRDCSGAEK